ncbi:MAG: hypothetical protein MJ252_14770, partial [archaeon]|nr:hypothetical protein [archaeon]
NKEESNMNENKDENTKKEKESIEKEDQEEEEESEEIDNEEENSKTKFEEVTEYELNEFLLSMILIMRNLSFTNSNESSIFHSNKFMHMLYLLFIHSNLNELLSNCLDIITNISCHIKLKDCPYASLLLHKLFYCLTSDQRELSDQALECFRRLTLPNGNDEFFDMLPNEFLQEFVDLLIAPKAEVRDSALEILYCISDQQIPTKTRLGKTDHCIQRLVALICSNHTDSSRMSKFAACVLSKLAEIPSVLKLIMPYEQELFAAACTDETITKVILGMISN